MTLQHGIHNENTVWHLQCVGEHFMLCQELNAATMKFTDRKVNEWEWVNTVELQENQAINSFKRYNLKNLPIPV